MKPAPLTPADSDLSDFGFMPLDVGRFRRSDLVTQEDPEAIVAAVLLWGAAWHSKPAASLSNDNRSLAQAAGFGRAVEAFLAIKDGALKGFVECSDGRLYHPVVAEKAREAWEAKLKRLWRTECARIRKANERAREKGASDDEACPTFNQWRSERYSTNVTRDTSDKSRVTNDDCHARHDSIVERDAETVTRDNHPEPDLAEAALAAKIHKTRDNDERGGASHATRANVERDIEADSCARAEKGQGQGQGQGDSNRLRSASPITGDDDFPMLDDGSNETSEDFGNVEPTKSEPLDLIGKVEKLGRISGLNLTVPAKLVQATDQLKQWLGEGIDFEGTIVPAIETRTRENPTEPIFSLKYFDAVVRKAHAVASVGGRPHRSAPPPKPKAPIGLDDDADQRCERFRARLAYAVGPDRYAARYAPGHVAVTISDERFLTVTFRSSSEEATARMDEQAMNDAAQRLGLSFRSRVK